MIDPKEDGISHINIYSKGKTSIGRILSNFAYTPFVCEDGKFLSIEGYWYWLGSDDIYKDRLRFLYGYEAKMVGRELRDNDYNEDPEFKEKILKALKCKFVQNNFIAGKLLESKLPFEHYYVFTERVIDEKQRFQWIIDFWENERIILKNSL